MSLKAIKYKYQEAHFLNIKWTHKNRLEKIGNIMALSNRDWSEVNPCHYSGIYKDAETWSIWCLSCCDTKHEAIQAWNNFCDEG